MKLAAAGAFMAAAAAACMPAAAVANVTININQVGPDVVATGSGSLNLTDLTVDGASPYVLSQSIAGFDAYVALGDGGSVTGYSGLIGPSQFGSGGFTTPSTSAGTSFGLNGGFLEIFVPEGYTPGTAISDQASWLGQSFATLGLTPGQYIFIGPNDLVTVNISSVASAVPEPATWTMMLLGFGALGISMRGKVRMKRFA